MVVKQNPKPEVPKQIVDTSEDEDDHVQPEDSDSDSDCDAPEFKTICHPDTGIQFSVDLKRGLYYDINAPGKSLGTYDKETNTFN